MKSLACKVMLVGMILAASVTSYAQNSNVAQITLNAAVAESITVGLSGNTQTWASLTPGAAANAGSGAITVTTNWVLRPGRTQVRLYAFFASTVALASQTGGAGSVDIPTSAFQINSANLGAATTVNQDNSGVGIGVAGSSLILRTTAITGLNRNGSSNDALTFNIDLSSAAMQQLPADTYQGTLNIQAQATP
jgi:hypothetical protein